MHSVKYGSGEQVIIGIHGWSGDHTTFAPLIKYLPQGITFYSVDLPGSGKSASPDKWKMESYAKEVASELLKLSKNEITLIGSCSGGLLCLFIAKYLASVNQKEWLTRMILIDPYAYLPWYFSVFVAPKMGKIGWYAYYTTFANPVGRWLTNLSLWKRRTEAANLTNSFAKVNHLSTYQYLKLLSESGDAGQFKGLSFPIDIVYGDRTFSAVKASIQQWKKILPQVSCISLKGVGHLPLEEATADLAAILFR